MTDSVPLPAAAPDSGWPGISVVTPCEGRLALVKDLLVSLAAARAAYAGPSEAILVDSSEPETAAAIEALCGEHGAAYLRGSASVRMKRNRGLQAARHAVVLFVDSDCQAEPDLLVEHGRVHRDSGGAVAGCAGLVRFETGGSLYWQALERTTYLGYFSQIAHRETVLWAPTANASFRADLLRQIGGFDEQLPFRLGGDDVDLGLRISAVGGPLRCNPRAVVHHSPKTWRFADLAARAFRWGRAHYHLFRKHVQRRTVAVPNVPIVLAVLLAGGAGGWLVTRQPVYLLLPWAWLAICLPLEAMLLALYRGSGGGAARDWLGAQLALLFNAGAVFEGLRHFDPRILFMSLAYTDPQPGQAEDFILAQRKNARTWAMVLALAATAMLAPWVAQVF